LSGVRPYVIYLGVVNIGGISSKPLNMGLR
jgi:hypothetical protein